MTEEITNRKIRCAWDGCWKTTEHLSVDGWSYLAAWGPPVNDGYYCQAHAAALEAVLMDNKEEETA